MPGQRHDVAIIGGGIVGLATARALLERMPGLRLIVLEKERSVGQHQTGHNSGVIHAGLYYKPGSFKARLCIEGVRLMKAFCAAQKIPVKTCGKLVVATRPEELPRLQQLFERGRTNGVPELELIEDKGRIRELEPQVSALSAIYSPTTASVDYAAVANALAAELIQNGALIATGLEVRAIHADGRGFRIETPLSEVDARGLINCAGLYSDVVARMAGAEPGLQIVPFRGEYYMLKPERRALVRGLIYPVPDPEMPFLGVHLTRTVHDEVEAGPNAVLAFAREGYRMGTVRLDELGQTLRYRGFWAMASRHLGTGMYEMYRSLCKSAFVRDLQRLVPALRAEDLERGGAGVRAQAVRPDGGLYDDFQIVSAPGAIHVLNAPSPAATASLAIGRHIALLAAREFGLGKSSAP